MDTQVASQASANAADFFHTLKGDDGKMITEMRTTDGYINATKMCRSGGKDWYDYMRLGTTKAYLSALESEPGITGSGLIQSKRGGKSNDQGTWIHPRIATHLAQWISAKFAAKVSDTIERYIRGEITTEESRAVAAVVQNSVASSSGSQVAVIQSPQTVAHRVKPQYTLESAGCRDPNDLMRPHIYFGTCGPELQVIVEQTGRHLLDGSLLPPLDEDVPPPYDIVRLGKTDHIDCNPQRKRAHDAAFGGQFDILDWVACSQPGLIEQRLFHLLEHCNRKIVAKAPKKTGNDQSNFRPSAQHEYNYLVHTAQLWAKEHDENSIMCVDKDVLIEREKTEQEHEKTEQERLRLQRDQSIDRDVLLERERVLLERERTKQFEIRLQLAQLEARQSQQNHAEEAPEAIDVEMREPSPEVPSVLVPSQGFPVAEPPNDTVSQNVHVHVTTPADIVQWMHANTSRTEKGKFHLSTLYERFSASQPDIKRDDAVARKFLFAEQGRYLTELGIEYKRAINIGGVTRAGVRGRVFNE